VATARAGKINEDDAHDEGGFNTFPKRDEKSRKHKVSSCKPFATTF
jgi:hypothetical protein